MCERAAAAVRGTDLPTRASVGVRGAMGVRHAGRRVPGTAASGAVRVPGREHGDQP